MIIVLLHLPPRPRPAIAAIADIATAVDETLF